jgi:multidrug efflux pump subunit AcrA (membrane-fusion protein)
MTTVHFSVRHLTGSLLFLMCFLLLACSKKEPEESSTAVPVQVAEVEKGSIESKITADAVLYPINQASITPKVSAAVSRFLVNRGDPVKSGQLLAVLENRDLMAVEAENKGLYDQAKANFQTTSGASLPEELIKSKAEVEAARQAREAAQKMLESRKKLFEEGALAERQVDEARVAFAQASGQYETARQHMQSLEEFSQKEQLISAASQLKAVEAHYQGAQAQLEYSKIVSPLDGVVSDRPLYPGEMATAGIPLLTIMDISRVVARAHIPVQIAAPLKVGAAAQINLPDGTAPIQGKVSIISPAADPGSTTLQVWVETSNPKGEMKPGTSVRVSITAGTIRDATLIPVEALLPSATGNSMVMVVGSDSAAHMRNIVTGVRQAGRVQVLQGVSPGEKVITVGGLGLEDNAKVVTETNAHDKEKSKSE